MTKSINVYFYTSEFVPAYYGDADRFQVIVPGGYTETVVGQEEVTWEDAIRILAICKLHNLKATLLPHTSEAKFRLMTDDVNDLLPAGIKRKLECGFDIYIELPKYPFQAIKRAHRKAEMVVAIADPKLVKCALEFDKNSRHHCYYGIKKTSIGDFHMLGMTKYHPLRQGKFPYVVKTFSDNTRRWDNDTEVSF